MHKNTFLILLCILSCKALNAQNDEQLDYKNNILFNPLSAILFSNFEFQYERSISNQSTLSLAIGLSPSSGLIRINGFDSPSIMTSDFEFEGIRIMPEYRWYFQNRTNKRTGLYLGGYYRFKDIGNNITGTYTSSSTGTSSAIQVDVDLTSHTVGALLGYKVMVGQHFFFDITIAGPGYSSVELIIREEEPLPDEFYADVANEIVENFNILADFIDNIEIEVTRSNSGEGRIGLPALRYGFRIGYAF